VLGSAVPVPREPLSARAITMSADAPAFDIGEFAIE
jgi:hypothetical protein